jgi:polysaccharide deacetylase 2 family uncharacterized protein YibQ
MAAKKKKRTTTKTTPKKRKKRAAKPSKFLLYTAWTLAIVALVLLSVIAGYYLGIQSPKESAKEQKVAKKELQKEKKSVEKRLQEVLKKEAHKSYVVAEKKEVQKAKTIEKEPTPPQKKETQKPLPPKTSTRPKLVIILDDVSTRSQVAAIKSLHMPLTMSFLPPSKGRPNSAKLAAKEPFYMVHLPMEAMHFNKEEPYTLRVSDSQEDILKRVGAIKELFPRVAYINNHTGSKFTSSELAMERLFVAFKKYGIHFVDSRTTAQTKAAVVAENFGLPYVARDVFLDHHQDKAYVLGQIKQAIRVAKAHGKAIAICHPHKNTLQALKESKALLNREVQLVLIKDL